ncbi:MAG: TetR/AcrR family transcriptional regulator [Pseudomonadota bacterium]
MARPQKLKSDEVLDRASDLFWRLGCDGVSTRDLETALDLRAPAIYRRFSSKNELLARCIDHYVERIVATRIERVLENSADPILALHQFFVAMLEPHGDEPSLRGCLLTNTAAHRETQADEVRDALERGLALIEFAFESQIHRAVETGQLSRDTDAAALAKALFMSLQGLLTLVRAGTPDLKTGIDATFSMLTARWMSGPQASKEK